MSSLGVILARGGSKGIPRKNLVDLGGKPLLWWTIDAALESGLDHVWVSTDSDDIAAAAVEAGAMTIDRPEHLATGSKPDAAVRHALGVFKEQNGDHPAVVFRLQPTSPFRSVADINAALNMVADGAQSVVGISEMPKHPCLEIRRLDEGNIIFRDDFQRPRQDYSPAMAINGAVYCARVPFWLLHDGFYGPGTKGYVMPAERSIDIDTEWDLTVARALA